MTFILQWWDRLSPLPGGRILFSKFIGRAVPYSGTIGAVVEELQAGHVVVTLRDRRAVRNHLRSIHAIALANLAELSSGLALNTALPPDCRGICTRFEVEYLKKARGTLRSECRVTLGPITEKRVETVAVEVKDASGQVVCTARAHWLVDRK